MTKAKGGTTGTLWNQNYSYDRYGNRTNVTASGTAADSSPIPLDGIPNLTYDNATNRITTSGFQYDVAGNQTRTLAEDGVTWVKYEYDAANRLQVVRKDDTNQTVVQTFQFGSTNSRLISYDAVGTGFNSFYCSVGGTVLAEYTEIWGTFTWTTSYTYLGDTQLATITPSGSSEVVEFNHPDRLGTRLKTNQSAGTSVEQAHLPFGTALNAESTLTNNNKRFTSYDRSSSTGLDYAINRTYDNKLGRFTQVDPIGISAADFNRPQTLNLYNYCGNDPINHIDPDGLFFGKLFKWIWKGIKKALKWLAVAVSVAIAVVTIVFAPYLFATTFKLILGVIAAVSNAAQSVLSAFGLNKAAAVFGIISAFAGFGTSILEARRALNWKTFFGAVSAGATAVSKTLSAYGCGRLEKIFGLIASASSFISAGLSPNPVSVKSASGATKTRYTYSWNWAPGSLWKFARSAAEQIASIAGATRVADFINAFGIIDDISD